MNKKNQYIDLLKGLACIVVVFLHCPFPGIIGIGFGYVMRFSVPVFFMVSGYFSYIKSDKWIRNKAIYILKLICITEFFYGIWEFLKASLLENMSVFQAAKSIFENKNILKIIFCGSFFNGTLWYLYAIFWTWIIILIFRKLRIFEKTFYLIPVLLMFLIFGRLYVQNTYDINDYIFLFRNAMTFGVPFTLLGSWIAKYENIIRKKVGVKKCVYIILAGMCLVVAELIIIRQYLDAQVSTVIISFGMFAFTLCYQNDMNKLMKGVAYIGSKCYTWIYLSHIFFIDVINIIYKNFNFTDIEIMGFVKPFVVLMCVCSSYYLLDLVKNCLKQRSC